MLRIDIKLPLKYTENNIKFKIHIKIDESPLELRIIHTEEKNK